MKPSLIGLLFSLLALSSCLNVDGTFRVLEAFKVLEKKTTGGLNTFPPRPARTQIKEVMVEPGTYTAELEGNSKRKITLEYKTLNGDKKKIAINIPKGTQLPTFAGKIKLTGAQMEQPFDLDGIVDSEVTESDRYHDSESCTYTVYERQCYRTCNDNGTNCRRHCDSVPVTRYGYQSVEYFYRTTDTTYDMNLLAEGSDKLLANFTGNTIDNDKIYLYRGTCY